MWTGVCCLWELELVTMCRLAKKIPAKANAYEPLPQLWHPIVRCDHDFHVE
jgi:hypothetical protein